jgi:hypothetical protein
MATPTSGLPLEHLHAAFLQSPLGSHWTRRLLPAAIGRTPNAAALNQDLIADERTSVTPTPMTSHVRGFASCAPETPQ